MKKIWIIGALALGLSSCTEVIDFDLNDSQTRIVVEGEITDEAKSHLIKISESISYYFTEDAPGVTGADVSISDGVNTWVLTEIDTLPGYYLTDPKVKGEVGNEYTLRVVHENQTYEAVDTMRASATIDDLFVVPIEDTLFGSGSYYWIIMFGQENPGVGDHYVWDYYKNDTLMTHRLVDKAFGSDDFVDGASPADGWPVFTGLPLEVFDRGDSVTLEMRSVSADYFDFIIESLLNTAFRGGFFDGPPANVRSNVSNGALGYFRASAVSRKKTRVFL